LYETAKANADGKIIGSNKKVVTSAAFPNGIPATLPRVHTSDEYNDWHDWYLNNGKRILPPYAIKEVDGIAVGIVGCTTRRGPQVVGKWVVKGIEFSDCTREVPKYVKEVREQGVQLVVLITEIEVGANIEMVSTFDSLDDDLHHIDVILNSDMHEETVVPIEIPNKSRTRTTLLIEEGQDGTMIGEIKFTIVGGKVADWDFTPHRIHDGIVEDAAVAAKVAEVRAPFNDDFVDGIPCNDQSPYWSKLNESCLIGPLNAVVGTTQKALHRSGFTDEASQPGADADAMPAAIEGTSHDWIADAVRWWAKSDLATVRGFRYGTHVAPGPITRNDLYHFVPIAARIGKGGKIHANQLRNQVDNSSLSVFSTSPLDTNVKASPYNNEGWAGGWMFAYSGPTLKFDPYWVRRGATPPPSPSDNTGAYPGDSRSRAITVTLPCDRLPSVLAVVEYPEGSGTLVSEKTACDLSGAGSAETVINQDNASTGAVPGNWTTSWNQTVPGYAVPTTADVNDPNTDWGGQKYRDLVVDENTGEWSSRRGPWNHNKFHHAPRMEVAGYYYARAPYTLNNCPNCNPRGTAPVTVGENLPDGAPYLLPVNMDPATGRAMLDSNGRPVLKTVTVGGVTKTMWENGHPVSDGVPIDLTEVLEKYLQVADENGEIEGEVRTDEDKAYDAARGRGPANPESHRITLIRDLPGRDYYGGVPMMQPLCGVVASYFSNPPSRIMPNPEAGTFPECPQ
jgi:hypothetical protein